MSSSGPQSISPSEDEMGIRRNMVQCHSGARFSLSVTFLESTSPRSSTHRPKCHKHYHNLISRDASMSFVVEVCGGGF